MSVSHKSSSPTPTSSSAANSPVTVEVKAGVFKNTCLELMDDVHAHRKEVVITKHGTAVAKLVAPDVQAPSAFGFLRGTLLAHGDIVSPDFEPWGELGA
ncbi:MAG: type II toxin-antitoxin system prevent-host-death family antitoxin [Gemmatimonadota bacterium]